MRQPQYNLIRFSWGSRAARIGLLIWMASALAPVLAQSPASSPTTRSSLLQREESVRERLHALEGKMIALARLLGESEPAQAERLRDAVQRSGERQVKRRLSEIVAALKQSKYSDANKDQATLIADLESILTALTNTLSDLDQRRAERERLEKIRNSISELEQSQRDTLYRTQALTRETQLARDLQKAAAELAALAEQQARLRAATPSSPEAVRERAAAQRKLEEQTRAAAADLEKLASQAGDEKAAESARKAQVETQAAAEAMQQAAEQIGGGKPDSAGEAQQAAEEKLRRAIQRLQEEQQRVSDAQRAAAVEQAQRELQRQAAALEQQMRPKTDSEPPTPGQESLDQAQQAMQQAADRLGEDQPQQAQQKEMQALQGLQDAMTELDDALRQIRREEVEETLTALAARFKAMLAMQEQVQARTVALAERPTRTRSDELTLAELAEIQRKQVADCDSVLAILTDEGSTLILPDLLRQIARDLGASAQRFDAADVSTPAQALIADIIAALREIVDSVESRRDQMQQEEQQGEGQPSGQPTEALLPGSAELKLLRSAQQRILQRTTELGTAGAAEPLRELAARQRELAEIARRMNERKP